MARLSRIDMENQQEIAAMNRHVLTRLRGDASVQQLVNEELQLFGIAEFFSIEECDRLRTFIDKVARPSPVFNVDFGRAARTSYSGDMNTDDPFIRMLHRRMDDLLGVDGSFGETLQGQRYEPGQEFKAHHDWFDVNEDYWQGEVAAGGQRAWTLMVYLNEVEDGGATHFPRANISIPPQTGTLVAWNNALDDGSPNAATLHAGTPVNAGVKYVVTRWYRSRKWY
ncbi:2OG-Fe(II) oxygenase [Croceicoccus sp. F390]|uniref:2OG-Fe(II) oxygenase n=1 Tax=Croceicoccus esteveae TaxID=3075597 RepID=A0ABU2ZDP3_9SPHN|nr:2OG-Fe(II) oxygenase [Croceicoccus sp. F390]MDT0574722.1 2OG-Fe(II) oxygenase [Croceicoccus sp. F390]